MDTQLEDLKLPLIVDIGSGKIKVGFCGEEKPNITFNNYFGETKLNKVLHSFNPEDQNSLPKEKYIGDDCDKYIGALKLYYPVEHGIFKNENDILPLFTYIFSKLNINSTEQKEHPILISEAILNPYSNREKIANILFENFNISALFFAAQPILSLFSTSSISGAVLESGDGVSQSCVVYEGFAVPCSYERYDFGGRDVSEYLKILLKKSGYNFYNSSELRIINKIKENVCYCVQNIETAKKISETTTDYFLPDGRNIKLDEEKEIAPEILFNPLLIGKEYLSLQEMIYSSITKVDLELRNRLFNYIMLGGGNTAIKGFPDKLSTELKKKVGSNTKIKIYNSQTPQNSCWTGGNLICALDVFRKMWVTKKDWKENGNKILHVKSI